MSHTRIIWLVAAFVALGALLWGATFFWEGIDGEVSGHGWFAYILGGVFTLGLSAGLFALTFYSARHGHDDIDPPAGNGTL